MQRLQVSGEVRPLQWSLGFKGLIKYHNNDMFRPTAAIIRFSSESMVVMFYRIGMVMSRW